VRSSAVVVPNVFREHHTQVPLAEDQYTVDEFGSDRAEEPFSETVRPRTTRRNPDYADAGVGENSIEGRGELTGPISHEEPELREAIAKIHHQIADLLGSPSTVRVRGRAQQVHRPAGDLQHEQHVDPLERHRGSPHGKSRTPASSMPARAGTVARSVGAPGRRRRDPQPLENAADRRGPHPVAELDQLALNSLISQLGFSRAIRSINTATASSTGGRPTRFG
jgi:hypothetical protein